MAKGTQKQGILREFSAGGVVYKKEAKKIKWLIVQPTGTNRWQFPKGKIDKNESSKDTALREVEEEGGVRVEIIEKIGDSRYFFILKGKKIFKTVTFYLLKYLGDTKEGHDWEVEETIFVPYKEAFEKLSFKDDKEILKKAKEVLDRGKAQAPRSEQQNLI